MKSPVKALYDELSKVYIGKLPKHVASDILHRIPKEIGANEDDYGKYVYITQVYTSSEYKSTLLLFDKHYCSPLHDYGEKEELVYSYRHVTPGLIKDHKIRNKRGRFDHITETLEPKMKNPRAAKSNVLLIKRTQWDSLKYDNVLITYTIYVFSANSTYESLRRIQSENTLAHLSQQLKEANEKGSIDNGSQTSEVC